MFFASALAMIVMGVVLLIGIVWLIAGVSSSFTSSAPPSVKDHSILVLDMGVELNERGSESSLATFTGNFSHVPGLYDVLRAIEAAKNDKNIDGIYLKINPTYYGWATLQQLRTALLEFKKSGKFIYAYGEVIPQKSYYLASVADSIFLNPSGMLAIKGLSSEVSFYKNLLSKLEIIPHIFYVGEYKSATEPFRETKISTFNREQIQRLQNHIWDEVLDILAAKAGQSRNEIHQLIANMQIAFPQQALENKLIDKLAYRDEVETLLAARTGKDEVRKLNYMRMDIYSSHVIAKQKQQDQRIAILFAEGLITDGEPTETFEVASDDFVRNIRRLRDNPKIKAVVLRVNSRGGSALASEVILRELQLLKEKKPLIASLGDVAASGGYYIASHADSIFLLPHTITGSIGIYAMFFDINKLLENKLGIHIDQVKNTPHADFPNYARPMDEAEKKWIQSSIELTYDLFKERVATGRNLSMSFTDSIARGRVWHGLDAVDLGLADGIGDINRAVQSAAAKAGIDSWQIVTYPEPEDELYTFMRRMKGMGIQANIEPLVNQERGVWSSVARSLQQIYRTQGIPLMELPFDIRIQ